MAEEENSRNNISPTGLSLLALSDEVLLMIFSLLDTEDKFVLVKVCRRFDRLLLDRKLCKDVIISSKSDRSCLKHCGLYCHKRRQLINSINMNSCYWMPVGKVVQITKNLPHLKSLHVINVHLPLVHLSKILKESKQLEELSWTWHKDISLTLSSSEVELDERMGFRELKRLHVCLQHPWCPAAQELYSFCCNLRHLTVEVDPSLGGLLVRKPNIATGPCTLNFLESLVVFQVSYCNDDDVYLYLEDAIGHLINNIWTECCKFNRNWTCLWTDAHRHIPWSTRISSSEPTLTPTYIKNVVIQSDDFINFPSGLPVLQLAIVCSSGAQAGSFPSLKLVAPELQNFAIITNVYSEALCSWINVSFETSDTLVEINLNGVHYCGNSSSLQRLWLALRSLKNLKKLAVEPCILPRVANTKIEHLERLIVIPRSTTTGVSKELSELLNLRHLEEFEVGNSCSVTEEDEEFFCHVGTWLPYIAAISLWTQLTCLTLDSISSIRSLYPFKLVALGCRNLSDLRIRCLGPRGHCSYVQDLAVALPHCQALKHIRIVQPNICDFIKDLLVALAQCIHLESICITNCNSKTKTSIRKKEDYRQLLLRVVNSCPMLSCFFVTLPFVAVATCNKIKNSIAHSTTHPKISELAMEFCSDLRLFRHTDERYHFVPKFLNYFRDYDRLQWYSHVAVTPPLKQMIH